MSEKEPDSELLELYLRQGANKNAQSSTTNLNKDTNSVTGDILSNQQYYKLVDDEDDQQNSFIEDSRQTEFTYNPKRQSNQPQNFYNNSNNSFNNQSFNERQSRKPISTNPTDAPPKSNTPKLPVIDSSNRERFDFQDSSENYGYETGTKKIVKWNFWWDKPESNIRVPFSYIPEYKKKINSKIGSFEKIKHKPGGGNIQVVNEKPLWRREAKVEHIKRDYQRKGGDIKILDQKPNWNNQAKIGSFENMNHRAGGGNIQILQQPFQKKGIKPRIDTGFLYEEVVVPNEYQIKQTSRYQEPQSPRSTRSPYSYHHASENFG